MQTPLNSVLAVEMPVDNLGTMLIILVGIVLMVISLRRRSEHRERPPSEVARDYARRVRDHEPVKGDMEALLVEIQEMARQISAQLDTKFAKLDVLLQDADDRIRQLERLTTQAGRPGVDVTVDDDGPRIDVAPTDGNGNGNGNGLTDEQRKIYGLADAGRTAIEIARQTGQNPGEVELILALRRKASS